ncbi:MAG TPA: GGDEF domain-containing protein [Capillimicrobium sp.]|nr:GGDEF domain-containing protein [Capillimicrobium sp.]
MGTESPQLATDPSDVRFWRRTLTLGSVLSLVACAYSTAYVLWTPERPNRAALLAIAAVMVTISGGLLILPVRRLMEGRARNVFFVCWSAGIIGAITVIVLLDGRASPLNGLYFMPLIFATMAYPLGPMILVGVAIVVSYLGVAIHQGEPAPDIWVFASCLTTAAAMCAWQSRLHGRQRAELARLSRADPLTGCLNRRGLQERLDGELARATRDESPLSLVLIDLDHFKAVNDRHGHPAGDALLCWTVERIRDAIRPMDALGRLGGDEFAVLLPGADPEQARDVAERIERVLAPRTGASTGAASFPGDGIVSAELHAAADRRLYAAKARPARSRVAAGR